MLTYSELESHDTDFILELEDSYAMRISPGPSNIRMIVLQMARSQLIEMPMFTMKYLKQSVYRCITDGKISTNRNAHVHNEVSKTISCGKPFLLTAF